MKTIGTWKDRLRRFADALVARLFPGGADVAEFLRQVDGYLYPHEAVFLYWVARTVPGAARIVEIGSFRGRSTLCMGAGLRRRGHGSVHAVDPHVYGTLEELRENVRHFDLMGQIEVVQGRSVDVAGAWNGPVQVVFLDGDHTQPGVESDLEAWLPHLAPGGLLVFHDSTDISGFAGPREVAERVCHVNDQFDAIGTIGSISWARRRGGDHGWVPPEHGKGWLDRILRSVKRAK